MNNERKVIIKGVVSDGDFEEIKQDIERYSFLVFGSIRGAKDNLIRVEEIEEEKK